MKKGKNHIDPLEQVFRNGLLNKPHKPLTDASQRAMLRWKASLPVQAQYQHVTTFQNIFSNLKKIIKYSRFAQISIAITIVSISILLYKQFSPRNITHIKNKETVFIVDSLNYTNSQTNDSISFQLKKTDNQSNIKPQFVITDSLRKEIDSLFISDSENQIYDTSKVMVQQIEDTTIQAKTTNTNVLLKQKRKNANKLIEELMQKQKMQTDTGILLFDK